MGHAELMWVLAYTPLAAVRNPNAGSTSESVGQILIWGGVFIGLLVLGFAGAMWYRRRLQHEPPPTKLTFTLADLRDMRAQGEITEAEFERLRSRLVTDAKAPGSRNADASGLQKADTPAGGLDGSAANGTLREADERIGEDPASRGG